ncbi:MAG: ATP-binding protein [Acidimicrobiales bacterium]
MASSAVARSAARASARRALHSALPARLRRLLAPVRTRTALAALVVVSFALAIGASGMLVLLHRSLVGTLSETSSLQASEVASLAASGSLPRHLSGSDSRVQVVDQSSHVLSASPNAAGDPALASPLRPGQSGGTTQVRRIRDGGQLTAPGEGPFLLVRKPAPSPRGALTVEVATSLDTVDEFTSHLGLDLAVGLPLLVLLVGATAWLLADRALRPVEAIRAEVADISGHDLHRRVPEPEVVDEIGRLARTMNTMLDRLETSASRQRRFLADASHELRTPLAGIQAQLEVALAHPGLDWQTTASEVLEEGRRLARLVEDLLALARLDDDSAPPRREPVDLDEVVMAEVRRLRARPGLVVDARSVSAGRVLGDADRLERVVRNLCDNAARHAGGVVTLELGEVEAAGAGKQVQLAVLDDGPGVAPSDRERVFERFTRLDEARTRGRGGAGLGLAIVAEIVRSHGGAVALGEAPAGGARVTVRLPAAPL